MTADRKPLDRWARDAGWADFDTYVRVGGSVLDARRDIARRISELESALRSLDSRVSTQPPIPHAEAMRLVDPKIAAEPPDPHNAHPQGDDAV